jgi:hypothetical protein
MRTTTTIARTRGRRSSLFQISVSLDFMDEIPREAFYAATKHDIKIGRSGPAIAIAGRSGESAALY